MANVAGIVHVVVQITASVRQLTQYPARRYRRKTIQVSVPIFLLIITSEYLNCGYQNDIILTVMARNTLLSEISAA
jgi:hypothetical protein